jgi:hypothetical protein
LLQKRPKPVGEFILIKKIAAVRQKGPLLGSRADLTLVEKVMKFEKIQN